MFPNITIAKIVVIPTDIGVIKDFLLVSLGLPDPINDFLRYILQIDKQLDENKKGQISKNMSLSRVVESEGIEPSSKQATKVLSTRLVFN